jgi:peptidoglycan endopeptidase LytE
LPAVTTSSAPVTTTAPYVMPTPMADTTPTPVPAAPAGGKEYTVVQGDAFYKIAKAHGVSITALTKANPGVDSRKLKVGQKLTIPEAAPAETAATTTTPAAGTTATEPAATKDTKAAKASAAGAYTVKAGDTLAKIAREHGTTVKALRAANSLKTDQLHPGQKLKLPAAKAAKTAKAADSTPANPDKN